MRRISKRRTLVATAAAFVAGLGGGVVGGCSSMGSGEVQSVVVQPMEQGHSALPDDATATRMLVGQWRDENSVMRYGADGSCATQWDTGESETCTFAVQGGYLTFTYPGGTQHYQLVSISPERYVITSLSSGTTYTAHPAH